jgi:hypothetical protein
LVQPDITEKFEETYTMTDFVPEEENTHHSGGKKEHRRGEDDDEEEGDQFRGGRQMRCQNQ